MVNKGLIKPTSRPGGVVILRPKPRNVILRPKPIFIERNLATVQAQHQESKTRSEFFRNNVAITVRKLSTGWAVFRNGKQVTTISGKVTAKSRADMLRKKK